MPEPFITIIPVPTEQSDILERLMELYLYDFSEFDGSEIGPDGRYGYFPLRLYWIEAHRHPFFIRVGGKLAGFVLVSRYNYLNGGDDNWVIAEFFVLRKYRRHGIGTRVACLAFDRFPGSWQVGQIPENTSARVFWRNVIEAYTGGQFQELFLDNEYWHGSVQIFHTPPSSERHP
jgi:predicted acetyltransferase